MNSVSRRVDVSAQLSDTVYSFEDTYTTSNHSGADLNKALSDITLPPQTTLVDSYYDQETGTAGIAVRDDQTGEIYIAYAGTNFKADGYKDIRSDAAIGLNDPLYLKKNVQPALDR